MDNCARENKNKYVFAFCSYLINSEFFKRIEISFLPVGHTHEDIDQLFSVIGGYLKTHDAYTVSDLKKAVKTSCSHILEVIHIEEVAQIKQLMSGQNWIPTMQGYFILN